MSQVESSVPPAPAPPTSTALAADCLSTLVAGPLRWGLPRTRTLTFTLTLTLTLTQILTWTLT